MFPGGAGGGRVNLRQAWMNNQTIQQYARLQFPAFEEIEFQVLAGGFGIGHSEEAGNLSKRIFGWLDSSPEARRYRETRMTLEAQKDALVAAIRRETKDN